MQLSKKELHQNGLVGDLQDDKEVVLEAVKQDGCALEFASDRLKDD